jgi:fumarate reductase iron-sulfur subunit
MAERTIALDVFRWRPDAPEGRPGYQRYEVPLRDDWVVLDALNHVKNEVDGTLTFRWSCRMGVCGSCGMLVNGRPTLTCAAFLRDYAPGPVRVDPLSHFPVVRDLVVDISDFLEKLKGVKPWIVREDAKDPAEGEHRQTPAQLAVYRQFTLCINCMLCYAACPVYGLDDTFVGPAALALAQRWSLDSRDQGAKERAEVVSSHEGIWDCTFVGDCTRVCPAHVDPAGAIQNAKVLHTVDWWKRVLLPWGNK